MGSAHVDLTSHCQLFSKVEISIFLHSFQGLVFLDFVIFWWVWNSTSLVILIFLALIAKWDRAPFYLLTGHLGFCFRVVLFHAFSHFLFSVRLFAFFLLVCLINLYSILSMICIANVFFQFVPCFFFFYSLELSFNEHTFLFLIYLNLS